MKSGNIVSVVVTAFNAKDHIARSVRSLISQTYQNLDVIVVSDDLSDYSEILENKGIKDKRVRFLSTGVYGGGAVNAVNIGIENSKSNYVAILDFDDEFFPEKIEKLLPLVKKYGAATSAMEFCEDNTNNNIENLSIVYNKNVLDFAEFLFANIHSYSNIFFDKEKIRSRFFPRVDYCGDILFSASMYDYIEKCGYYPQVLHRYYRREGSMCNNSNAVENFISAYSKCLDIMDDSDFFIKNLITKEILRINFLEMIRIEKQYLFKVQLNKSTKFSDTLKECLPEFRNKIFAIRDKKVNKID